MQTIRLTDRRPIRIKDENWPVIASVSSWDGQYESQAFKKWKIFVRSFYCRQKNNEQRYIVYGWYDSAWQGDDSITSGYVIDNEKDLISTIKLVCSEIGDESLARSCINDLPSEEIE